ncbi:MAG: hypothetical protein AAFS10_09620, partial [Myxococcota bacterium]
MSIVILVVVGWGCHTDSSAPQGGERLCTAGELGCPCEPGSICNVWEGSTLACVDDVCRPQEEVTCPLGREGCACDGGDTCGLSSAGLQMACVDGLCAEPLCEVGTFGCSCRGDGQRPCEEGLSCTTTDGAVARCMDCPVGEQGCACEGDRSCSNGLACMGNRCGEPDCQLGMEGCACHQNLTCMPGLVCNADALCEAAPSCTAGSYGCACRSDGVCDAPDAICASDGTCQRVDCPAGEEGCHCGDRQSCGRSHDGAQLACLEGRCQSPSCVAGALGCVCEEGVRCDSGAECVEGYCLQADCVAGEEHCRCTGGACGPGLRCSAGTVCVDRSGYTQGACLDGERCHFGNRCQEGVCVLCSQGSQGCDCRDNNTCNTGLACDDTGHCVDPRGLAQTNPDPRICTTPCSEGLTLADGRYLSCPANGLVQGCFGETTCVEGQCLKGGATARTCTTELECPDFQTCLAGACTSNCATADDCVVGSTCFRQVCRQTCAVDDEASVCGSDHHCHLVDGQSGVCKRNVPATGDSRNTPIDTFSVSTDAVDLNGISATATLVLTNHSPEPTLFTITKRSSVVVDSNNRTTTLELEPGGQCVSSACPLWWLELHEPQQGPWLDPVQTLVVEAGEETTLTLSHNTHHPRWEGSLEIRASNGGLRHVSVRHTNQPTGQWSGKVYTFGHFKDVGLAPWMDDRANPALTEQMENAFVRLWANFRQGRLSFEQFQAGLTSTRTESWRSQRLYALGCQEGSICFPYSNFEGFLTYTTDPINVPVPSGVVEMPMAMNLTTGGGGVDAACQGSDYCFVGRIESSNALQYAGNPKVVVKLASDPRSCSLQDASSGCLTFLDAMEATVVVGGRYQTDAQDATCSRAPTVLGEGSTTSSSPLELELVEEPWLVTGYHGRSELDSDTGRRTTHTCRDLRAP